ncbi:MAG: rod shape-determining protein [Oscillospiraceae bacterium]|jgi:rod shape-determining protein MreB|nr:rod shape-determining protein [Oscillospiraceae bacterium]
MGFFSSDIGIDLGTSNVLFYVAGRGVMLREQSLAIIREDSSRKALAFGTDASEMWGRIPPGYAQVKPIRQGVIADYELVELMIRTFLRRAIGVNHLARPRAVLIVPAEITGMERRAVTGAVKQAGMRLSHVIEAPVAAAMGCGLPVYEPVGSMIVDIGAGTTEAAVIAMGSMVVGKTIRVGGDDMDLAIMERLKKERNMEVGLNMAESIKVDLGCAMPREDVQRAMARGRDIVTGLPKTIELDSALVYEALREPLQEILSAVLWVLERTPPELGADVMRTGIHLTGGTAQLFRLDQLIAMETGIPVQVARNPMDCAVIGAGYLARNLELLDRIGKNHPLTE